MTEQTKEALLRLNGVRPWAIWCITHHVAWVVYVAGVLALPVCAVYYICAGLKEGIAGWLTDMARIRAAIKKAERA
mgnify:CR=1 FL=1|jgi:hypothetical protein